MATPRSQGRRVGVSPVRIRTADDGGTDTGGGGTDSKADDGAAPTSSPAYGAGADSGAGGCAESGLSGAARPTDVSRREVEVAPPGRATIAARPRRIDASPASRDVDFARGLGVVRIKPLGAGGGGVERSGAAASGDAASGVHWGARDGRHIVSVDGRAFDYPTYVADPSQDNAAVYDEFMPGRVAAFLDGYSVNVLAYGQTGTGKTYTMIGPPGIMARAAGGAYGTDIADAYGLFPRGVISILRALEARRRGDPSRTYVLTCSAVELDMYGNQDMFEKTRKGGRVAAAGITPLRELAGGVALNKTTRPPKLYGQTEWVLDGDADVLRVFGAIASRNTAGTGMNDSSSRSHCIVALTLHVHDPAADTVRCNRFQFCDLAGSERMNDAHGTSDYTAAGAEGFTGMLTNYSLTMLGACLREIAAAKGNGRKVSFRTYLFDLVALLYGSLLGDDITAVFVCVSQAVANGSQSLNSLRFGKDFSRLTVMPRRAKAKKRAALVAEVKAVAGTAMARRTAEAAASKAGGHGGDAAAAAPTSTPANKYAAMREALLREAVQLARVYDRFEEPATAAGSARLGRDGGGRGGGDGGGGKAAGAGSSRGGSTQGRGIVGTRRASPLNRGRRK